MHSIARGYRRFFVSGPNKEPEMDQTLGLSADIGERMPLQLEFNDSIGKDHQP